MENEKKQKQTILTSPNEINLTKTKTAFKRYSKSSSKFTLLMLPKISNLWAAKN